MGKIVQNCGQRASSRILRSRVPLWHQPRTHNLRVRRVAQMRQRPYNLRLLPRKRLAEH